MNSKSWDIIIRISYVLVLFIALINGSTIPLLLLIVVSFFYNSKYILIFLLINPIYEEALKGGGVLTPSKILVLASIVAAIIHLTNKKVIISSKKINFLFYIFILLILLSEINLIFLSGPSIGYIPDSSRLINMIFLNYVPKVGLSLMLFNLYNMEETKQILEEYLLFVPLALIVVSIYTVFFGGSVQSWYGLGQRLTLDNSDNNDFACILASYSTVSIYLMLNSKSVMHKLLGIISLLLASYTIFMTFSRGGLFALALSLVITMGFRKLLRFSPLFVICGILIFTYFMSIPATAYMINERFIEPLFNGSSDLASLSVNRTSWWINGIDYFAYRPFFGYGAFDPLAEWVNYQTYGLSYVFHNIYIELLFYLGLTGAVVFFAILYYAFGGELKVSKMSFVEKQLLVILFSGLALSWLWREQLWYTIAFALIIHKNGIWRYRNENCAYSTIT